MEKKYRIGYVDEDINQVKLYRRRLKKFGFEIIGYNFSKDMKIEELMDQIYISDIDLLMIDFRLNETNIIPFNGDEVERHIYDSKPLFPHIIFTNKVDQAEPDIEDLKIIFDKEIIFPQDDVSENSQTLHFVETLKKSIEQYKNYIDRRKNMISDILEKEETQTLNSDEKRLLLLAQKELSSLDNTKILSVPENMMNIADLDKISKARKDAEDLIESLLKANQDECKE